MAEETIVQNSKGVDISLEEAKEKITNTYLKDNPLYNQIVYVSNDQFDCVAIPFPKLDYTVRPFIIEEPKGIKHPKFNWETFRWEEASAEDAYQKMTRLQETLTESNKANAEQNAQIIQMMSTLMSSRKGE
ncbi:hypothetical protein [Lactobacillus sp. PV034]|uniref:hypothetical protein n=1 Tax=Lactobacillus sp. PV034 TaxID=2594495 RepID=UPI00223FF692|nr:hypothetical protein [Lactobacillus sp. PV034]QNQ80773.1 hypothetical protein FP432_04000 [Lactobacillus sp. PV034]